MEQKKKQPKRKKRKKLSFFSKIGIGDEKNYFLDNLAMMLSSGMSITMSLAAIKEGIRSKLLKEIIADMEEDIDSGSFIWRALKRTNLLPDHVISLIRIGEESGKLAENLKVVAEQQQKERSFKSKLRSALLYPVLVLVITVVVGIGISWFVLPRLSGVFRSLKIELPLITKILIGLGEFLNDKGTIAVPIVLFVFLLIIYLVFVNKKTKSFGEKVLLAIPGVKKLIIEIELSRFGFILGTLLEAGLPIVRALESLEEASSSARYKKFYTFLRESISTGYSFEKTFANYKDLNKVLPVTIRQMIISAEQSGNLSESFKRVGVTYEAKSEITTKNLTIMLEPILLVAVWIGVILVALAVILPIYSMVGQFRGS
jgi:type IV pilus assembly protein PilC